MKRSRFVRRRAWKTALRDHARTIHGKPALKPWQHALISTRSTGDGGRGRRPGKSIGERRGIRTQQGLPEGQQAALGRKWSRRADHQHDGEKASEG